MVLRLLPIAVVLTLVGCGGGGGGDSTVTVTTTAPSTTTAPTETTALRVYFLKDGKVQPVVRQVPKTQAVAGAALTGLGEGPTEKEKNDLGLTSDVKTAGTVTVSNDIARVAGASGGSAQVVYTLTQFPTVEAVEIDGKRYTRADFENETPIILVESPLPGAHVTSPLRVTGTANTFEATFNYDLVDSAGKVIATHFVTATSGSGQRGTYDFTVPFKVERPGLGKLVVYELSAKDGSRIHQSEIPVYLQ